MQKLKASNGVVVGCTPRQFVKVAAPSGHAGVGAALRQAFAGSVNPRLNDFNDLLDRLK